jgi:protein arginine kinase activator
MAESHKCQICGKPATVHLTQIVGNKIVKLDLCEDCAREKGVTDPEGFSLGEIFGGAQQPQPVADSLVCDKCGFSPKDFKKTGLFGCPDCYEKFAPVLEPMLRTMHRDVVHRGKVPARSLKKMSLRGRISAMEEQLGMAIKDERFEDAARIRDELAAMRKSIKTETK